jgi:Ca2+-binding RTX toxin-like protein
MLADTLKRSNAGLGSAMSGVRVSDPPIHPVAAAPSSQAADTETVSDYTALLSGNYWNGIEATGAPVIVTYSFPTAAPAYDAGVDGFTASTVASFKAFNDDEQKQARQALGEWSAASGITFVEVAPGQGDINFQLVDLSTSSYGSPGGVAFYPFGDWNVFTYPSFSSGLDASGDVFMNSQDATDGTVNYGTLLHEIGHALGLKHPTEDVDDFAGGVDHDQVLDTGDDPTRTVMATVGDGTPGGDVHLKQLDMDAVAFLYGASGGSVVTGSKQGFNSVSHWSWNATTGVLTQNAVTSGETIRGSSVRDVITATSGDNRLFGLDGADTLSAGDGDDYLDGGPGVDTMKGGLGDDTYAVDDSADNVVENDGGGYDTIIATASYSLKGRYVEVLQLIGSGNINATGNNEVNTLYGNDGDNVLDGSGGADHMAGGLGNDTYYVDDAGDTISEAADAGTDTVMSSISYTLGANLEKLTLTGTAAINGVGNNAGNVLTGNGAANHLTGGSAGDSLDGGGGADTLAGGLGDDTYYVDNVGDNVVENDGGGNDTIFSTVSYTVKGRYVETLHLLGTGNINASGNNLANTLVGNDGDNVLDGSGGADSMSGGLGNDTYYVDNVGDTIVEAADAGTDTVMSSISYTLGANLEKLTLTGAAAINGVGNDAGDVLTGNGAANHLTGGSAGDSLDGGGGADTLAGGLGDDTYYVDNAGDNVVEADGAGNDTIFSTVSYSLKGRYVETLTLTGNGNIDATGNNLVTTLVGNSGANILDGQGGNDTLTGGGGADIFLFDTTLGSSNIDTITDFTVGTDMIELDRTIFKAIGGDGVLSAAEFHQGAAAQTASQRIIYDPATGDILYDADGSGSHAAVQFAQMAAGLTLSASSFTGIN